MKLTESIKKTLNDIIYRSDSFLELKASFKKQERKLNQLQKRYDPMDFGDTRHSIFMQRIEQHFQSSNKSFIIKLETPNLSKNVYTIEVPFIKDRNGGIMIDGKYYPFNAFFGDRKIDQTKVKRILIEVQE